MKYPMIVSRVFNQPWAILPEKLQVICAFVRAKATGTLADNDVSIQAAAGRKRQVRGSIGVLPVFGTLAQRAGELEQTSGMTSTEQLSGEFTAMVDDPAIGAIVLHVDSPGGEVYGIEELGDKIFAARSAKPIVAIADSVAASAAYWIASQAEEFVVTPGGEVGSIGVFMEHWDISKGLEAEGAKPTLISAGRFKVEGNPYEPLGDAAAAAMQARVEEPYAKFLSAVARGRNTKSSAVRDGFGQGRLVGSKAAKEMGMVDRIATYEEVIAGLLARSSASASRNSRAAVAIAAMS